MIRHALVATFALGCSAGQPTALALDRASEPTGVAPLIAPASLAAAVVDAGAPDAPPSCVDGKPYEEATLRARLVRLASPDLAGRVPGTAGDTAARAVIAERFRCLGLTPGGAEGSFEQPFDAADTRTANVVGSIAGVDPEVGSDIIVIGAHHDHLGNGHLGANDNASGVVALLAIAQAMRQPPPPRRTIVFATFGGEEIGLLGSTHYASHAPTALPMARVVQYINLDMVGSYSSSNAVYAFGTFATLASGKLLATLDDRYPKLRVGRGGHSVRGDQVPFCTQGIPYVFFWTPDARCYHETCDTIDRLDLPHMAQITSLAGDLVHALASSKLDLAAARRRQRCGR